MAIIRAESVKDVYDKTPKQEADEICALLCYYYPYTLSQARRMPAKDIRLMLSVAERQVYTDYLWKLQIAVAPHTKKGSGVKKLSSQLRRRING